MSGSWPTNELPNLKNSNYQVTSPATRQYNCIAWAAGDSSRKWWPDPLYIGYWPAEATRSQTLEGFISAYSQLGYLPCDNGALEKGLEKVAIFATETANALSPKHAAIQLEDGRWSSKLGDFEDIAHLSVRDVEGPSYGQVIAFMSRPRQSVIDK